MRYFSSGYPRSKKARLIEEGGGETSSSSAATHALHDTPRTLCCNTLVSDLLGRLEWSAFLPNLAPAGMLSKAPCVKPAKCSLKVPLSTTVLFVTEIRESLLRSKTSSITGRRLRGPGPAAGPSVGIGGRACRIGLAPGLQARQAA